MKQNWYRNTLVKFLDTLHQEFFCYQGDFKVRDTEKLKFERGGLIEWTGQLSQLTWATMQLCFYETELIQKYTGEVFRYPRLGIFFCYYDDFKVRDTEKLKSERGGLIEWTGQLSQLTWATMQLCFYETELIQKYFGQVFRYPRLGFFLLLG